MFIGKTKFPGRFGRMARLAAVALTVSAFAVPAADARPGGGFSTGSRGLKTYTPPPATRTAPGATQQMQRSATPAPQQAARPATAAAQTAAAPSRFGGGFMGGLLGAGLIGALLGAGLFGGLGSLAGILGFVLQFALIGGLAYLAIAWFRGRNQPASAGASSNSAAMANGYQRTAMNEQPRAGSAAGGTTIGGGLNTDAGTKPLKIEPADFDSFERLLSVIQLSYGRGDVGALRSATTSEMLGYFTEQLDDNQRKGVKNEIDAPKLVSGDLAEAWSEGSGDYATVAMKYQLIDATVETAGGRVVAGSRTEPQDVTEVWTFTRRLGGGPNAWRLSAIQQVS